MTQSATDPDRSYKIGVVGAGLIGRKHIDIAAAANALHAIIDPFEPARKLAQEKQCLWASNLYEYLASHSPDGIIIATPNQLHVEHGLACSRHKIPMLIEKPIADIPDQAEELVKRAAAAGVPILVGHHRRHNPLIKAAKSSIVEGKIGQIVSVHAQFWLRKPDDYFEVEWRRSKGAGPILINLIHDVDLLRHLCGEVVQVQAMEANKTRGHEVEDSAAYPATDANCYTIGGTMGALSIPDMTLWNHPQEQSWWAPIDNNHLPYETTDPLLLQFQHFLDIIDGKAEPLASGAEGLQTLRVISAIKAAGETGTAQTVASNNFA